MHYYSFNIGDYRRDTGHLNLIEHGIYRSLIDTYILNEEPLINDKAKLMRTHNIRTKEEKECFQNVVDDFFFEDGDFLHNSLCDKVLEKIFAKSKKARESAEARWKNKKRKANAKRTQSERKANGMLEQCEGDANYMRTGCEQYATHNPLPINPLPKKKKKEKKKTFNPLKDRQEFIENIPESIFQSYPDFGRDQIIGVIDNLINYCQAHGKTYKDYYAALRNFLKREKPKVTPKHVARSVEELDAYLDSQKADNARIINP